MDRIRIVGGNELHGVIPISGAKNAALPLMIASLLTDDTLTLENVPHLADVEQLIRILGNHGADISVNGRRERQGESYARTVHFTSRNTFRRRRLMNSSRRCARASGLSGRCSPAKARRGCLCRAAAPSNASGRPLHRGTGSTRRQHRDRWRLRQRHGAGRRLIGARYVFPKVSVGATHVLMMAATLANGTTVLGNAAREPEVVDLAKCLNAMGAKISGQGTSTVTIEGVRSLSGARHRVLPDRIETGTYAMAVAMAGGDVILEDTEASLLDTALEAIRRAGAEISETNSGIRIVRNGAGIKPVDIVTDPFPGFPTDLQAQFMGLMTRSSGVSHITETIFENRFMHVQELARLGAKISLSGQTAKVEGVSRLKGAPVMATDLRASVSLVIAGLAAEGETMVSRVYHLDRGFERLEEKLTRCGAHVERVSTDPAWRVQSGARSRCSPFGHFPRPSRCGFGRNVLCP